MADEPKLVAEAKQAAPSEPASKPSADPKVEDMVSMTKAEFDAFVKAQIAPWEKKHSDLQAAHGRLTKQASLTGDQIAALTDSDRQFEHVKRIVLSLGVPQDEIKDAESVRDLDLLLRGYQRKTATKAPEAADAFAQFQEWQKAQTSEQANGGTQRMAPPNSGSLLRGPARTLQEAAAIFTDEKASPEVREAAGAQFIKLKAQQRGY